MQGFLLLRRANGSAQARIAIVTLAGNSLSFSDVRKACKRCADEFLRDPKKGARRTQVSHSLCVTSKRSKGCNQEGDIDVDTAFAALNEDNDTDLEETDVQEILLAYKGVTTAVRG